MIRRIWLLVATALLLNSPRPAQAELATVNLDYWSIEAGGRHRLWVSVLDDSGHPILGQGTAQFSIEEDGIPVRQFAVIPYAHRYSRIDFSVIVDSRFWNVSLASGTIDSLVQRLRGHLSSRDRLRVVSGVTGFPSIEVRMQDSGTLLSKRLESLGSLVAPRTLDAATREIRRSRGNGEGRFILMVTGGPQGANESGMLDLRAHLRKRDRPATISLIEVGDSLVTGERNRLMKLVQWSGGGTRSVNSAEELVQAAEALLDRARGAYLIDYQFGDWEPTVNLHRLRVTFRGKGNVFSREVDFSASDHSVSPWWTVPQPWIAMGLLFLFGFAGVAWVTRARPLCRLRVETGEDRGCSYEIIGLPIRIGAIVGNDLVLDEPLVSRSHAILERRRGRFELSDQNSENGTYVNGERVARHSLSNGDQIGIGIVKFRFLGPR